VVQVGARYEKTRSSLPASSALRSSAAAHVPAAQRASSSRPRQPAAPGLAAAVGGGYYYGAVLVPPFLPTTRWLSTALRAAARQAEPYPLLLVLFGIMMAVAYQFQIIR
jgi:hypothetical protein